MCSAAWRNSMAARLATGRETTRGRPRRFSQASIRIRTGGADVKLGISADQIAAKELGKVHAAVVSRAGARGAAARGELRFWLHLRLHVDVVAFPDGPGAGGNQSACSVRTAVWRRAKHRPRERMSRLAAQKSVLDYVTASLVRLQGRLGVADKRKLEEYLESVRDIERRIQLAESQNSQTQLPLMDRPSSIPQDYGQYSRLMMDLMVVAWQSDMTRVASFMLGREGSNRAYPEIGISDGHHSISHHQGDPEKVDKLLKIDELHVSMYAYLLKKLQETQDGDGSLLDHSLILFGSSLSESNLHTHDDLPIVLAGSANGQIKGNRHLVYPSGTPLNNLFLNMFDAANVPHVSGFGDSTGRLSGL